MTPEKNGRRKSKRGTTAAWKEGDTRALLRAPTRRAPEEIASDQKKAAEKRNSKDQAKKAKEKKTARDIQHAAELEDALVKEKEEAENAFPRRRSDVGVEDDEPGEESPTRPSKQPDARRQAQLKRSRVIVEITTPSKPVQGHTGSKTQGRRSLKRSHAFMILDAESAQLPEGSKKKHDRGVASEEADKPTDDEGVEGGAVIPHVASRPKPRPVLKRTDTEKNSGTDGDGDTEELEDADPFDLRHRKRGPQPASPLNEPGQSEKVGVSSISEEEGLAPRPKRTAAKKQVINDGLSELASADDPPWEMRQGDDDEGELSSVDSATMEDDLEDRTPRQTRQKDADDGKGKEKDLRAAILQERSRKLSEVDPFQPSVNDRDIRRAKATSGVSKEWLKQNKATTGVRRRRPATEDSDDDLTAPKAAPSKKRITNSRISVVAREQVLPSKQSRRASTSGNSEKVCDKAAIDVQTSSRYGGLEDEDDTEEWNAIRQSPVKERGVRVSNRNLVKVESPTKPMLPATVSKYKSSHLPAGASGKWRHGFVTTFAVYIATKHSPWEIKDKESLDAMQDCWNHVYRSTVAAGHQISGIHDVVFVLGDQRWKELRNSVGKAALDALDEYFKSVKADTNLLRRDESVKLSVQNTWLYGAVERNAGKVTRVEKPFYNPLVLKTFGAYFKWTKVHDQSWPEIKEKSPVGALGLAITAVERAIRYWANLAVSPENADKLVGPFNKSKKGKSEPDSQPFNDPSDPSEEAKKDEFGRIGEFNADLWSPATKEWIVGARKMGFDSMAVMQPLINAALQVSAHNGSSRSHPGASGPTIGPTSASRCKIAEGAVFESG